MIPSGKQEPDAFSSAASGEQAPPGASKGIMIGLTVYKKFVTSKSLPPKPPGLFEAENETVGDTPPVVSAVAQSIAIISEADTPNPFPSSAITEPSGPIIS